jgi:hypothetical protein
MRSIECSSRSTHIFTSCLPIIVCINMFLCAYKENILCHTTSALPLIDEKATDTACAETSEMSTEKRGEMHGNTCLCRWNSAQCSHASADPMTRHDAEVVRVIHLAWICKMTSECNKYAFSTLSGVVIHLART